MRKNSEEWSSKNQTVKKKTPRILIMVFVGLIMYTYAIVIKSCFSFRNKTNQRHMKSNEITNRENAKKGNVLSRSIQRWYQ